MGLEGELSHESQAVGPAGVAAPVLADACVKLKTGLDARGKVPEHIRGKDRAIAVF